ncbi:MAG: YbaK/EbsC family protein [Actinobacteria bacterium]|nr:YbaK/EbsC family protein [Actinomycetota bacterium]
MTVVTEHLEQKGINFEVLPHARTVTAMSEAHELGLDPDEVIKAVVLDIETGHALGVIPASCRLDLDLIREALADETARLATEDEIEADLPEFELGAVPPLPSLLHVPVVIDPKVLEHRRITFAAGSQRESVRTSPHGLFTGASVTITPITRRD